MSKRHITQFRFFGDQNSVFNTSNSEAIYHLMDSNTDNLTMEGLIGGSAFEDYYPIVQLGIQSLPGLKFTINSNFDPIIIGTTGIYELDLIDSSASITSLAFDKASLELINQNPDGYLIIDIVYEED